MTKIADLIEILRTWDVFKGRFKMEAVSRREVQQVLIYRPLPEVSGCKDNRPTPRRMDEFDLLTLKLFFAEIDMDVSRRKIAEAVQYVAERIYAEPEK